MAAPKLDWSDTVCQIASLTLANAFIFQEELAVHNPNVKTLGSVLRSKALISDVAEHWTYIIEEINYVPIFKISRDILEALPSSAAPAIRTLARTAVEIVAMRAALRHDLMGRIYHRLLLEAKYLGTYYTSISSATLLLKLSLAPDKWQLDWSDPQALSGLRIADLASGTGTLLMASVQGVGDNHVRSCAAQGKAPDMAKLHGVLMESVLYGFDVVPSALHLTASTLALLAPEIAFKRMNLYCVPMGGPGRRLGSIDFLEAASISVQQDLFGAKPTQTRVTGKGSVEVAAEVPQLDLAVMNPPFTRSVGGNLLFGSLPAKERAKLQERLRTLLRQPGVLAQSTAGLGSVFVALADKFLKPGGRQALVLPRNVLSGVSWAETRKLLSTKYHVEYVIVSHDPDRWAFSENTELSEALLIARKLMPGEKPKDTVVVGLWRNPVEPVSALALADAIQGSAPAKLTSTGTCRVGSSTSPLGETWLAPLARLGDGNWWYHAFAQTDLIRVADGLLQGELRLPTARSGQALPVCKLGDLGELGPDRRDIHDGFTVAGARTPYAAFWGHDEAEVDTLEQDSNAFLAGRTRRAPGRPLRDPQLLWSRAGRLLLAERLWLNSQRLHALCLSRDALSNVWWPFHPHEAVLKKVGVTGQEFAQVLALWLNSTLGLVMVWSQREETRGAWIGFKKPIWSAMPVLDPRGLPKQKIRELCDVYDQYRGQRWARWAEMAGDATRAAVDQALARILDLPDYTAVRELLAREPVVSLKRLGADLEAPTARTASESAESPPADMSARGAAVQPSAEAAPVRMARKPRRVAAKRRER